jgi:peroxiredoxin
MRVLALACLVLLAGVSRVGAESRPPNSAIAPVPPVAFGDPFPPATFPDLNAREGGPSSIDLSETIGKRPVIFFYWIAGNPRADEEFQRIEALAKELGPERVALYGVAMQRPGREADAIVRRLRELGIETPVLDDTGFRIGQQLRVQSVPNISILDSHGILRLSNGATLTQDLEYKMTVETALRRVAEKGTLGTYGFLAHYYPVKELVGKRCPDFEAPLLKTDAMQKWETMLRSDCVNILVFWSVDCPHCRRVLPEINEWLKEKPSGVNVVSAVKLTDAADRKKIEQFCDSNGFVFPTLLDRELEIARKYQVTSTPTILVIRPDGVIDSVMLSTVPDFRKTIEEKKRELLQPTGS